MDELRWFLLILGIVVIAAVFLYGRIQDWRHDGPPWRRKRSETRQPFAEEELDDPELHGELSELDSLISEQRSEARPAHASSAADDPAPAADAPEAAAEEAVAETPDAADERATTGAEAPPSPDGDPAPEHRQTVAEPETPRADPGGHLGRVSSRLRGVFGASPAAADADSGEGEPSEEPPPATGEEKIVSLNVMAPAGMRFSGPVLVEALQANAMRHGAHGIFHRTLETRNGVISLYSAANIVKPGWFDLDEIEAFESPGVVFFMQLPGPFDGLAAFEQMLQSARSAASQLGGHLLDARRCDLTQQTLEHIREELVEYRRRAHLAARQAR